MGDESVGSRCCKGMGMGMSGGMGCGCVREGWVRMWVLFGRFGCLGVWVWGRGREDVGGGGGKE